MIASGYVAFGLNRNRRETRGRSKRLRRQHGLGEIETEELIRAIFGRHRRTAAKKQRCAKQCRQNLCRNHFLDLRQNTEVSKLI
jgi:hypothetical protein